MNNVYTAVIKQDGDCWIGWIEEVPGVNCQEASRDELLVSLKVTLEEMLELNRQEAIVAAGGSYQEERSLYEAKRVDLRFLVILKSAIFWQTKYVKTSEFLQ
jgi:predicted RNase H-like HicB family nuclease